MNPNVDGVANFSFDKGTGQTTVDFNANLWSLNGGCPTVRNYDAIGANGAAVQTHRYKSPQGLFGGGALVMNRNDAENWNTIMMTFPFFDMRDIAGTPAAPGIAFLGQTLAATLPPACQKSPTPTNTGEDDALDIPPQTALHQNVPNPFNPTTEIRFDLAQSGKVRLRIYDVAGRLVRTLIDEELPAGRNHTIIWNGLDNHDRNVASGIYFYRLDTVGSSLSKKMVVMK